jgi:hypothetical protein
VKTKIIKNLITIQSKKRQIRFIFIEKINNMANEKLKPGDRVRLLYMEGESLSPGTWGTVKTVSHVFGDDQYVVFWDDGDQDNVGEEISSLALISSTDIWKLATKTK